MSDTPLRVVADEHIFAVRDALACLPSYWAEVVVLPTAKITAATVRDADVLLTRTGVRVDAALLQGSKVRFAGTATIGDDHYDKTWLNEQGIAWATAAGSSTLSVVEYVLAALFHCHSEDELKGLTLGIVGVGRIGRVLARVCERLGMRVLRNDPPRARLEGAAGFVSLDDVLAQADIVTLHTPLIRDGDDVTEQLLDDVRLAQFKGHTIINAARGACVDNQALLRWLDKHAAHQAVMDCWEHEPKILATLLQHQGCIVATPHIAGHSLDGKAANTQYIYDALCRFLQIEAVWDMEQSLPPVSPLDDAAMPCSELVQRLYPIAADSQALKQTLEVSEAERGQAFVHIRRHYPVRRRWVKQSQRMAALFQAP